MLIVLSLLTRPHAVVVFLVKRDSIVTLFVIDFSKYTHFLINVCNLNYLTKNMCLSVCNILLINIILNESCY